MVVPNNFDELHGRVLKSQIESIRQELSNEINHIIVKDNELKNVLTQLKNTPDLVIADNQTIEKVFDDFPEKVKLTTYALIITRQQGYFSDFVKGIKRVKELEDGDKVLISEGCENHLQEFEMGKMKIQEWLKLYSKKKLQIDFSNGCGYSDNLSDYNLLVHCDGCSISKKVLNTRIKQAKLMDIPIVNYSVLISYIRGVLPRVLLPFEDAIPELGMIRYI